MIVNPENVTPSSGTYPLEPTTRNYHPSPASMKFLLILVGIIKERDYKI